MRVLARIKYYIITCEYMIFFWSYYYFFSLMLTGRVYWYDFILNIISIVIYMKNLLQLFLIIIQNQLKTYTSIHAGATWLWRCSWAFWEGEFTSWFWSLLQLRDWWPLGSWLQSWWLEKQMLSLWQTRTHWKKLSEQPKESSVFVRYIISVMCFPMFFK